MHPATRRALVELYAATRLLCERWATMAGRLAGDESVLLRTGADHVADLLAEVGALARARGIAVSEADARDGVRGAPPDRLLRRNEALRAAVLDVQHVTTLIAYAEALGRTTSDDGLTALCAAWEQRLLVLEEGARGLAIAAADEPDHAIAPADGSPVERARRVAAA